MLKTLLTSHGLSKRVIYKDTSVPGLHSHFFKKKVWSFFTLSLAVFCLCLIFFVSSKETHKFLGPLLSPLRSLSEDEMKKGYEIFGFAPFWKMNDLANVDFATLTTFAYFGVPVKADGSLDKEDYGYSVFHSKNATDIFRKAHQYGTRVVLTITQMDNDVLDEFLSDTQVQDLAIKEIVEEVRMRGIDGVNVDFEYVGNPGNEKRQAFSAFVKNLTAHMHTTVPGSRVTVSVYASSAKSPKLYDVASLADVSDGLFMMAYDFAVASSSEAMPTAPLYGKKEGKYPYDIATAVDEFLKLMPANKLILGVPYYGYNYMVDTPEVKTATLAQSWRGSSQAQTYESASKEIQAELTGWDETAQVGWQAYFDQDADTWRMLFLDDVKSLGIKYDFAKKKELMGVGMWALGFDEGKTELWTLLRDKFGTKSLADIHIVSRQINESTL